MILSRFPRQVPGERDVRHHDAEQADRAPAKYARVLRQARVRAHAEHVGVPAAQPEAKAVRGDSGGRRLVRRAVCNLGGAGKHL